MHDYVCMRVCARTHTIVSIVSVFSVCIYRWMYFTLSYAPVSYSGRVVQETLLSEFDEGARDGTLTESRSGLFLSSRLPSRLLRLRANRLSWPPARYFANSLAVTNAARNCAKTLAEAAETAVMVSCRSCSSNCNMLVAGGSVWRTG